MRCPASCLETVQQHDTNQQLFVFYFRINRYRTILSITSDTRRTGNDAVGEVVKEDILYILYIHLYTWLTTLRAAAYRQVALAFGKFRVFHNVNFLQ